MTADNASSPIASERMAEAFTPAVYRLIELIVNEARNRDQAIYLAGGMPRDLLLRRRTQDLDFVLEGDAIGFARSLSRQFGGRVEAHTPFGTAKWLLDGAAIVGHDGALPAHIDFAMARKERYEYPAALPTVSRGCLEDDLERRDFSINAMALKSASNTMDLALIDPHGGTQDLARRQIRVLHAGSFRDDPTRLFRAIRFATRFGFELEAATAAQLRESKDFIALLSGERIRNEIAASFKECQPERVLRALDERGLLLESAAQFRIGCRIEDLFHRTRRETPPWRQDGIACQKLHWILLFDGIDAADAERICDRLALNAALTKAILAYARLSAVAPKLEGSDMRPSQITRRLRSVDADSIHALWLGFEEGSAGRTRIGRFMLDWRFRRATIDGACLKRRGLPAGPRYAAILNRLRDAWLDGEIGSETEERALLHDMLAAG